MSDAKAGVPSSGSAFCRVPCPLPSVRVSAAPAKAPTPWLFSTVPVTVTDRSSALSTPSSTAVIVTLSAAFAVAPAGIVMAASVPTVYAPSTAVTVTVVSALDAWVNVAVNVVVPPSSEIARSATISITPGAASSSRIVSVTSAGDATPLSPPTVADTVTSLSGASTVLSTAVTVTAPVLVVAPAAMVSVFVLDRLKSVSAAFVPAVAATVSVTAALDARFNVAVTVLDPGFVPSCSAMVAGPSASVTVGAPSSSVMVRLAPVTVPTPWLFCAVPLTVTVRLTTLSTASSTAVTVTLSAAFDVAPAGTVMVASDPTV